VEAVVSVAAARRGTTQYDLTRRLAAEALGTFFLVMAVVGSGIMAEKLAGGNGAIALLCNTLPTGAVLFVIITIFVSVSGAQFNPAVTLVMLLRGEIKVETALGYVVVQIMGGCLGAVAAHLMFGLDPVQLGSTARRKGPLLMLWTAPSPAHECQGCGCC